VHSHRPFTLRLVASITGVLAIGAALLVVPSIASADSTTVVANFGYTGTTATFTVPDGITQLSITATGGQGGRGGVDTQGLPASGGYAGVVSGTMSVTPGQVLTIAVGQGGSIGATSVAGTGGGAGGNNPLSAYKGGVGGNAGSAGASGAGGGGGAATVITTTGATLVAAGAGGGGGSGQFFPLDGRAAYSTFSARTDATSTTGQVGLNVNNICTSNCDGGGSGAGGGGAQGGAQGNVEFGTGQYTEWFGYGGYPGSNSTASISGLGSSYQYYPGNSANGSLSISYVTGAPNAPTAVGGSAEDGEVDLTWTAPGATGQGPITDYSIRYALASAPTSWTTVNDGISTATAATVTGLTDGVGYLFEVAATNTSGTGSWSTASATVIPSGPPSAPTALVATPADGALSLAFTAATSVSPITDYQYQVGSSIWVSAATTTSPVIVPGLTNGQSYVVQLRAVSAIGVGAASSPITATPQSVPGAPSITSTSTDGGVASVVFTPGFSGGGRITDYEYQLDGAGDWLSGSTTSSPLTISGLANGSSHTVAIRARNAAGASAASQSSTITMPGAPDAPTVDSITANDSSLSIAFAPGSTGGSPVTSYQYQLTTGGIWNDTSTMSSPLVIADLVNGTTYQVSIRAINGVGTGAASVPQSVTPATTPGAPAIVGNTVAGSDSALSASFTAPSTDGGAAVTGYEYSTDAGATWRVRTSGTTASPLVITTLSSDGTTPLTNGTLYLVEVRAVNSAGEGTASAVASGIAKAVPSAPAISTVVASSHALAVTFQPGSNGGAAVTSYQYRLGSGTWTDTGSLGTGFIIGGLTNGTAYDVSVRAVNSEGNGAASATATATPVTLPGQPTISSVTRADRALSIAMSLPGDGGSAVTRWEYTTDGGATWATATGTTSPLVITTLSSDGTTRLVNSTAYAVALRAVNAVGTGVASATSTAAPSTTPVAPTASVAPLNQGIRVTFALSGDGGSPISAIEYSLDGGNNWTDAGTLTSPFVVTGLANGTSYAVQVRADNVIGTGSASTTANVTPRTVPDAPTDVTASSNTAQADVAWAAPDSTGGSPITGYTASAYAAPTGGSALAGCTSATTACSITGLTNGTLYYVSVTAQNAAGSGLESTPRVLVTPLARPSAPTITTVSTGNSFLTVNFTAGAAGSSAITGYDYQLNGGAWVASGATTTPITLSGLTNGTSYAVALRADSAAGFGTPSSVVSGTPFSAPDTIDSTQVFADGQDSSVVVTWPAANANGSPVIEYDAVAWSAATIGSQVKTCTLTGTPIALASTYSCTLTGLSNGTTYWITVQSTNGGGASIRSARIPVTPNTLPGAVGTPIAVAGNQQVGLSWPAGSRGSSPVTDYQVWYSANGGSYVQFAHSASTALSSTVTGLTNGVPYTFKVFAVNTAGTGAASAISASATPKAPGVAPTASAVVSTANGYTFTIDNYDPSLTYALAAGSGVTASNANGTVTMTGVAPGVSSPVTVTASSTTVAAASTIVSGTALVAGIAPTLSTSTRTADGFTFTITNPTQGTTYSVSTNHGTAALSGSTVTVTGLAVGATASVVVTASRTGSTDASTTQSSLALALGTAPTFQGLAQTADGFTFTIGDYDPTLTYTFGGTNAAVVDDSNGSVTVSHLQPGASSDVTVTATLPGQTTASAIESGTALTTGVTPVPGTVTGTVDGFTFAIANYDQTTDYVLSVDHGSVAQVNGLVAVTGLTPGQATTVDISADATGATSTMLDVVGAALSTGVTPTFGSITPTANGYSFTLDNYSADVDYTFSAPIGVTVSRTDSTVTVTGLAPSASANVTVTASRPDYTDASAVVSGTALAAGTAPDIRSIVPTADGFTFTVGNYDAALVYTTTGATATSVRGAYTVTGLAPGASAAVTVTATDPGVSSASSDATGTALETGLTPTLSTTTSAAGGYSFDITNRSDDYDYSFATSAGGTATLSGSTVTVTGLAAATVATTTVTANRAGHVALSAMATGTTFGAGTVPSTTAPVRTDDGYTFTIDNYDADYGYTVTSDSGHVVATAGSVVVTGLGAGQRAIVHIATAKSGELDESTDVTSSAISAGIAPSFSATTSTANGFTFTIANYSTAFAYSFAVTGGATVTANGAAVTVTGLAAGKSAAVTVSAAQAGFHDASSVASGSAKAAPAASTAAAADGQHSTSADDDQAPAAQELDPGVAIVMVDGVPVKFLVTQTVTGVTLTGGGLVLKLTLKDAVKGGRISDGIVTLKPGSLLHLTVKGFRAGTLVGVWTFSTATLLTQPTVAADTSASDDFGLPSAIPIGHHTLVVKGTSAAGSPVSISLGYIVAKSLVKKSVVSLGHPDGGSTLAMAVAVWIGGVVLAAIIAVILFIAIRRRKRKDDEDDDEFERSWQLP
jgi:hypothetical protein